MAAELVYFDTNIYNLLLGCPDLAEKIEKARSKGRVRIIFSVFNLEEMAENPDSQNAMELFRLSRRICSKTHVLKVLPDALRDEVTAFLGSRPQPYPWYVGDLQTEHVRMWIDCCGGEGLEGIPRQLYEQVRQSKKASRGFSRSLQAKLSDQWGRFKGTTYEELWDAISRGQVLIGMVRAIAEPALEHVSEEEVLAMTQHLGDMKTFYGLSRYICAQIFGYHVVGRKPKWGDERDMHHAAFAFHFDLFVTEDGDFADVLKLYCSSQPRIMCMSQFEKWIDSANPGITG